MTTRTGEPFVTFQRRQVPARSRLLRHAGARLASFVLRCDLVDEYRGWARAESLLGEGYGLIAIMNHFSVRDAPQALALLARSPVIRRRPYIAPVASHQLADYHGLVRFLTGLFAIELCPVITPFGGGDRHSEDEIRSSYRSYRSRTATVLQEGGIMLLAPQARRAARLGEPPGHPVAQLLRHLSPDAGPGVALLFIGFGIPGVRDYARAKVGGLNLQARYEARIGATVTVDEARQELSGLGEIDQWVFERLRAVVPPSYA